MANEPLNPSTLFAPAKPKPALAALAGLSGTASAATSSVSSPSAFPWAARLHTRDAIGLWDLRLLPHVEAGFSGEFIWLRGPAWSEQAAAVLGSIPSAHWFEAQPGGRLREIERLLPTSRLPQVTWQPLSGAMQIAAPPTALPAQHSAFPRVPLELKRSAIELPANLLVVEAGIWRNYIDMEPEVRFRGLYFAVASDGRVCVGHAPPSSASTAASVTSVPSASAVLPSLPGRRYRAQDGIAVPCGWTWSPSLPAGIVRSAIWEQRASSSSSPRNSVPAPPPLPPKYGGAQSHGLGSASSASSASSGSQKSAHPLASHGWLYLWHADRAPEWIGTDELIPLSRSAARLSLGRHPHPI